MFRYIYFSIALLVSGCSSLAPMSPEIMEKKIVSPIEVTDKNITLNDPQVWFDGYQKNSGVMLPKGTYLLEAEDLEYLYFRAPSEIEFRLIKVKPQKQEFVTGGIALSKRPLNITTPAVIYESTDLSNKMFRWKLGSHFLQMEGNKWKKSY